jgi:hypothetical protein
MENKKQQRREAKKQRDTERKKNRRNKETYGFTMDAIEADKLRKSVK